MAVRAETQTQFSIRKLEHGGFLVSHADIYELGCLYFASTTLDEAFEFVRGILTAAPAENGHD